MHKISNLVNKYSKYIIPRLNIVQLCKVKPAHSNAPVPQALVDLGNVAKHQCYQDTHGVHSSSGGETTCRNRPYKKKKEKGKEKKYYDHSPPIEYRYLTVGVYKFKVICQRVEENRRFDARFWTFTTVGFLPRTHMGNGLARRQRPIM